VIEVGKSLGRFVPQGSGNSILFILALVGAAALMPSKAQAQQASADRIWGELTPERVADLTDYSSHRRAERFNTQIQQKRSEVWTLSRILREQGTPIGAMILADYGRRLILTDQPLRSRARPRTMYEAQMRRNPAGSPAHRQASQAMRFQERRVGKISRWVGNRYPPEFHQAFNQFVQQQYLPQIGNEIQSRMADSCQWGMAKMQGQAYAGVASYVRKDGLTKSGKQTEAQLQQSFERFMSQQGLKPVDIIH